VIMLLEGGPSNLQTKDRPRLEKKTRKTKRKDLNPFPHKEEDLIILRWRSRGKNT